jgi:anti-sigma factor RsiW
MPLTDDQRAMLQLILERGQSYDDLAGVLGVGVDEVRSRARAALAELGGTDPDAEVGLTDYLLGQADPIGRADAVRHLQADPESAKLARELVERLREVAPEAALPQLPEPRERRRKPARKQPAAVRRVHADLSRRQQQVIVALAASAVLVIAAVLAIAGVFGGSGDSEGETGSTSTVADTTNTGEEVLARIPLRGERGSGEVVIGTASADQPFVDLSASGIEASPPQGQGYVLWFLLNSKLGYPFTVVRVSPNGTVDDRYPIPNAIAVEVATRSRFIDLAVSPLRALQREAQKAARAQRPVVPYTGDSVLRGSIPAEQRSGSQSGGNQGGG